MIGSNALVVFGLLLGVFVEQCDIGDFAIDDFSNNVVVTNASKSEDAFVSAASSQGEAQFYLRAGASKTFTTLAATEYSITVSVSNSPSMISYRDSLWQLRDWLLDLSLNSSAPPDVLAEVLTQLFLVQSAVQQLKSDDAQSCGHKIGEGVDSRATMTWTGASNGSGLWVLDCG